MASYVVKAGDTLSKIASQYGTTVGAIAAANNISNPNVIGVGQTLTIGGNNSPTPPVSTNDINSYRDTLSNISSDGMALEPRYSPISSQIYPASSPSKAPVVTPTPTPSGGGSYVVKAGDSLSKIAAANGMTLQQLLALNPTYQANPNLVKVGATVTVKGSAPSSQPSPTPTPTPEQTSEQKAADLAAAAGKAGLSVTEYTALLDRQNTVSKEESDAIAKELGIPALEGEVFKKPSQTSEQLFTQAYATAGLADIKTKIAALDAEISKTRANLTEATGAIDENPFLTEASRVGRGKRLVDQANATITNLQNDRQQYLDLYTQGIKEINDSILRQQSDFQTNNSIAAAQLNYLVAKADKEVAQLKDKKTAASNGSLGAYLKSVAEGKAPTTIGNSESGFYKYDQTTGKFVQVIAPSALSQAQTKKAIADAQNGGDGSAFKPTADQKAIVGRFANSADGTALGFTAADKARMYTDPNFFYWILQKASEAGYY